jgi:hypothetical protein
MSQDIRGVSAKHISRELGLRYATSWTMPHKPRRALGDQNTSALKGVVEVDETYYDGKGSTESKGKKFIL